MKQVEKKLSAVPTVMFGVMAVVVIGFSAIGANALARLTDTGRGFNPAPHAATALVNPPPGVIAATNQPAPAAALPPAAITPVVVKKSSSPAAKPRHVGMLDSSRQFALGMIETANNDREIGRAGEVSRYQIMPSVWKHYSASQRYHDPGQSLRVAREHWLALYHFFKREAKREPTDFDMYVLWNTRHGYYARKGYQPARLGETVRDRAQRFTNLVGRGAA